MPIQSIGNPLDWNVTASQFGAKDSPEQVRESARQFESLLIGQIMRSMRETAGGWLGAGEDQAGSTMAEFAEQQMAQVLSANGGFGLASLIEQGLTRSSQPQTLNGAALGNPAGSKP